MTELKLTKFRIPAADIGPESNLPAINEVQAKIGEPTFHLDEDDGLFVGFGALQSAFPYRMQDNYGRELTERDEDAVVLENEHLRALFLPGWGGRLWSLWDKDADRELTFANPVIRPANLAIRNAWLSGGVEWNCGMVGHHPYTCDQVGVATTELSDGTPVLRMYQYERIRNAVYQMDFFLPEDSRVLYARMRIVNPNRVTTPMYWWSNIAVPENQGSRVIMDARETYNNRDGILGKNTVPVCDGVDITYPVNNPHSVDFFWKIPEDRRKYVCQLDSEGYGLIQTSTRRLQGRKLFVWGQGPGGDRWQKFLTADNSDGRYVEIQAGVAHTQYECLPMPPKTAWEWLEAYGALQADPAAVHGEWEGAVAEVSAKLETLVGDEEMEKLLRDTREMATSPAQTVVPGVAWATLERRRREADGEENFCPHLEFAEPDAACEPWTTLLSTGEVPPIDPAAAPTSWICGEKWMERLESAPENWYTHLLRGTAAFAARDFRTAREECAASESLCPSAYGKYLKAQLARIDGDMKGAAALIYEAAKENPADISMVKEAFRYMTAVGMWQETVDFYRALPAEAAELGRVKLCYAKATLGIGDLEGCDRLLHEFRTVVVPDIREGENTVTELWFDLEEERARREGRPFDRATAKPPAELDFRMSAEKTEE
ncbi:MAG: DUF5107 domain-containing protein [Clostridia bacterium]|nr:DUF5107 domain-containing protein [Clostridia bacterium]